MTPASIGSISTGTLRSEDLITAMYGELEYQLSRQDDPTERQLFTAAQRLHDTILDECWDADGDFVESEHDSEIIGELCDALDTFSPPYCYFGAHEGDGADFGYWPSLAAIEDFDGLRVDDWSEVTDDYVGDVLHVNDHGNVSIYWYDHGQSRPVIELV